MTRTEILLTMHEREPRSLFYTMELGGSGAQLRKLETEGLIRSRPRYRSGRQRDWYLDAQQHKALSFLFGESQNLCSQCPPTGSPNRRCERCPRQTSLRSGE